MITVVQRVLEAAVRVGGQPVARIDHGLVALVAVVQGDGTDDVAYTADRLVGLRVFADDAGKMNMSVSDVGGSLLLVSQFTLAADTRKGRRPSFSNAAPADQARARFDELVRRLRQAGSLVETGVFGADMHVSLLNDGPVTLILDSRRPRGGRASGDER